MDDLHSMRRIVLNRNWIRDSFVWRKVMARLSECVAGSRNALVFLDMLSWAKVISTKPATARGGYDVSAP